MAIDFPSNPTNGQTYLGYVYSSSVGAWQAKPSAQSPFYTSDTPPTNPVVGDAWFNTNDGTMYIYFNDGNTSQWVEHRSEIARSQVGLVPVRPTSVTVGSGTASVDVNGLITFTGASSLSLNGIFTSSFRNYKIIIENFGSSLGSALNMRLRVGGVDRATSSYFYGAEFQRTTGVNAALSANGTTQFDFNRIPTNTVNQGSVVINLVSGNTAQSTKVSYMSYGEDSSSGLSVVGSGICIVGANSDGMTFFPSTGTFTGTMKVYGCN